MTDGDICQDAKLSTESVVDVDADIVERQRNAEVDFLLRLSIF
jgi:hypothetical protein